jgi:hypothetical protein
MFSVSRSSVDEDSSEQEDGLAKVRVFKLGEGALYFFALGCFLDVFSTFFPWSNAAGLDWFLPLSVPFPLNWQLQHIPDSIEILSVNLSVRFASVLGIAGLFFLVYLKRRLFSNVMFVISIVMSFAAAIFFSQLGWSLYLGVYLVLVGALLKVGGFVLKNLEVEIVSGNMDEA